jgi:hypothetical protein
MAALKLNQLVEQLADVRNQIAEVEDQLTPLKEHEAVLREALVTELKAKQMKTVNSELTGELYTRAERFTFKVSDELQARVFADKHDALKIDTTKVAKLLRTPNAPMPEDVGFTAEVTEYLSIRTQKED